MDRVHIDLGTTEVKEYGRGRVQIRRPLPAGDGDLPEGQSAGRGGGWADGEVLFVSGGITMPGEERDTSPFKAQERSTSCSGKREINATNLREFIVETFNADELKTLCKDLRDKVKKARVPELDYEVLSGDNKAAKARELVGFMERHLAEDGLQMLADALKQLRPVRWEKWFGNETMLIRRHLVAIAIGVIVTILVLFLSGAAVSLCPKPTPTPTQTPTPKAVCIKVDLGRTPADLTVSAGGTSIFTVTARSGIIDICLPYTYEGQQVELKAKAEGFVPRTQTIPLTPNATPLNFVLTPMLTSTPTPTPSPTSTPWVLANAKVYPMEGAQCITEVTGSDPTRPGMIKIMFDTTNKGSWCTWVINLGRFDASQKTHLAFWVKGEKGGERFDVGIKDATTLSGNEPKMEQTTSTEWRRVLIPLQGMQNIKQQDLSALENFSLGFTDKLGSGIIYVQGFVFEP